MFWPAADIETRWKENEALKRNNSRLFDGPTNISANVRIVAGEDPPLVHEITADLWIVTAGTAVARTDGRLVENGGASSITNATSRTVRSGDVLFVPPGVPHHFTEMNGFRAWLMRFDTLGLVRTTPLPAAPAGTTPPVPQLSTDKTMFWTAAEIDARWKDNEAKKRINSRIFDGPANISANVRIVLPGDLPQAHEGTADLWLVTAGEAIARTDGQIVDANGKVLEGAASGNLCIADAWPGMMRTVYGDHQRFVDTYFKAYPGKYFTSDGCRRDEDGYYWITGRVDDVINVAGHRLGTAEVESALVAHAKVSEAAVVGYPHDIKGQGIYAYVTLMTGEQPSQALHQELIAWVRKEIGPIASPDLIQFSPSLPKTRSGKIMRRILRKIAEDEYGNLGDVSTLADPTVVEDLVNNRQNRKDGAPPPKAAVPPGMAPRPDAGMAAQSASDAKPEGGGFFRRLFGG